MITTAIGNDRPTAKPREIPGAICLSNNGLSAKSRKRAFTGRPAVLVDLLGMMAPIGAQRRISGAAVTSVVGA